MKIYDMFKNQFAVYYCEHGCFSEDISRDETDFRSITLRRVLSMEGLKKMQEEEERSVYDVIAYHSDDIDQINKVSEYEAITEDGEEFFIYIVDGWD